MKITHDCGGEFTLPDYVPAIGKMLSAECIPSPEGVFLKDTDGRGIQAELGGVAVFRITYVPEDGGRIFGATVPCDYETSVMIGNVSGPVVCRASTSSENVFCRVTAPRKLQLRCRLGTTIMAASESEPPTPQGLGGDYEEKRGDAAVMAVFAADARDLLCSLDLSSLPESSSPVSCAASVNVTECRQSAAGEFRCRGEIAVSCLYEIDGNISTHAEKIPFDETVFADGGGYDGADGGSVRGCGRVDSAEIRRDDSGSRIEIVYSLSVEAAAAVPTAVIYDAYSCASPCEVVFDDVEYLTPVCCMTGNVSVNEKTQKSASGRVCGVTAQAVMTDAAYSDGRLRLSGELRGCALLECDGELGSTPFSIPWTYEPPASETAEADSAEAVAWGEVNVISLSARADGELAVDAELSVSATAAAKMKRRVVVEVSASGDKYPPRDGFTVYYPLAGESMWDIAKRFHVPTEEAARGGNAAPDGKPASVVVI